MYFSHISEGHHFTPLAQIKCKCRALAWASFCAQTPLSNQKALVKTERRAISHES